MLPTKVILVGGFLGAGKTTLIAAAAQRLQARGRRVGVITNDQAANLVDTAALAAPGLPVQEVAGGCFCCRFDEMVAAMDRLLQAEPPDVLIGEPVGSCTDLSATVLQPMKQLLAERFQLAPFSVLVDATRLRALLQTGGPSSFPANVLYIYRKQLEEADLIVLNKTDLASPAEVAELQDIVKREFPQAPLQTVSATDGTGVEQWLDQVLSTPASGRTIVPVDYDVYAEGEAALGWLNAAMRLKAVGQVDWAGFCRTLIESIRRELQSESAEIAHLKLHLTAGDGTVAANLTSNADEPSIRNSGDVSAPQAGLLLNVRAHADPVALRSIVERLLRSAAGEGVDIAVDDLSSFAPARPEPMHRFGSVQ